MVSAVARTKNRLAFYGSTPAYRHVLDLPGWGDLQDELNSLSKQGRWDHMGEVIPEEVLISTPSPWSPHRMQSEPSCADPTVCALTGSPFYTPCQAKGCLMRPRQSFRLISVHFVKRAHRARQRLVSPKLAEVHWLREWLREPRQVVSVQHDVGEVGDLDVAHAL